MVRQVPEKTNDYRTYCQKITSTASCVTALIMGTPSLEKAPNLRGGLKNPRPHSEGSFVLQANSVRQPGHLREALGFASPPRDGFALFDPRLEHYITL
jgi:hypothetical protein